MRNDERRSTRSESDSSESRFQCPLRRHAFAVGDPQAAEFHEGSAEFGLYPDDESASMLVAADGTVFAGEPLISFAIQQYSNGTLTGPQGQVVLANYRGTKLPRGILCLDSPD